jgi:hypothetical protein
MPPPCQKVWSLTKVWGLSSGAIWFISFSSIANGGEGENQIRALPEIWPKTAILRRWCSIENMFPIFNGWWGERPREPLRPISAFFFNNHPAMFDLAELPFNFAPLPNSGGGDLWPPWRDKR